ncbi:MAG: glycosyltransferase [Rhodanobacteraceae bacterium]|nr:glycosyltransferase [Rhodanobacteraceae bacterium]HRX99795.1 glycosyltransferase [Xanthomonadaceae bacterium]
MKLLVIAYEFPPLESAHGIRWGYLAAELAIRGHSVTVITSDIVRGTVAAPFGSLCNVVQVFPGPFVGASRWLSEIFLRRNDHPENGKKEGGHSPTLVDRCYRFLRWIGGQMLVPDVRTEWLPWGFFAARRAIREERPDVIIASHEPGVDLAIARRLRRAFGIPVLADLGDPVVSPYTPDWRRWLDARLERRWLEGVAAVSVTTRQTRDLLRSRVPSLKDVPVEVLTQGFDARPVAPSLSVVPFEKGLLELLYTGTLYARFRSPAPLLEAVQQVPDVRLTVAGHLDGIDPRVLESCSSVRYVGRLTHEQVKAAQREADVLLNIGNDFGVQIPGKLFEYLGAGRPIMHLASTRDDASVEIIRDLRCGVVLATDDTDGIVNALKEMRARKSRGELAATHGGLAMQYSWQGIAGRLESMLLGLVANDGSGVTMPADSRDRRPE